MNENTGTGGFYAWIDSLRTVRSPDRWIGGVVAGASERLGIDRTLGRALMVVLTLLTAGITVLLYGLAWMVLPEPDGRIHAREAARGRWTAGTTGALIVTVLGLGNLFSVPGQVERGEGFWGFGGIVGLAIIGLFMWLVATRGSRQAVGSRHPDAPGAPPAPGPGQSAPTTAATAAPTAWATQPLHLSPSDTGWYATPADPSAAGPSPATPRPEGPQAMPATAPHAAPYAPSYAPSYSPSYESVPPVKGTPPSLRGSTQLAVVGLAVLAGAAVSLLRYLDVFTASWPVIWAASLATAMAVMAIGLIVGAIGGRGGGGLTVATAILTLPVVGATGAAAFADHAPRPWGVWTAEGEWDGGQLIGNPADGFEMSFGDASIDLTDVQGSTAATADPVAVDASFSTVELVVPDTVDVYLDVDNSFSSVNTPDLGTDEDGRILVADAPGDERLVVAADLSFSTLTVRTAPPSATGADDTTSPDSTQE